MTNWQDISTAPKDGSHIVLYRPEIQFIGYYAEAGWCTVSDGGSKILRAPTHWREKYPDPESLEAVIMREGRCLMSDGPEGVVKRSTSKSEIAEGYPWVIFIGGASKYLVNNEGRRPGTQDNWVVEMLRSESLEDNPQAVFKSLEAGDLPKNLDSGSHLVVKAGCNYVGNTLEIEFMVHNRSPYDYKIFFDLEQVPEPEVTAIEIDEEWLFRWATCVVKGADPEHGWFQSEFEPTVLEGGGWHTNGRFKPIDPEHAPTLPDGMDWRDTLTFVENPFEICHYY